MTVAHLHGQHVLVLGGMGFIGSNLALACLKHGASVTVFDSLTPDAGGNRANIPVAIGHGSMRVLVADVRDTVALVQAVRGATLVFQCAALTSHSGSMRDPRANVEVNCLGVINVLEAIRLHNPAAKLVYVGTSTQVGRMQQEPIDERHPEFPLDIYSANKSAGEKYVLIYARTHGLRAAVVRLSNNYGPRACIRTPEFGFMNYFVGLGLQGRAITVFGDGSQRRNISFVDDSVAALLAVALEESTNGEVYFATADQQVTVRQVSEAIVDVIGGSIEFVEWPADRAALEIGDAVISNDKIRSTLDWAPSCSLADGLARTRDYFASRMTSYL